MKIIKKQRSREITKQIHDILWLDWDPIGVNDCAPEDEYDSYIGGVYRLLVGGCKKKEIIDYLESIAQNKMGLSPVSDEASQEAQKVLTKVAEKLLTLNVTL